MNRYFYVETKFTIPYGEMVVSQDDSFEPSPALWFYDEKNRAMEDWPLFKIEWIRHSKYWYKIDDECFTYLPDDIIIDSRELWFSGQNDHYPPGFNSI